MDVIRLICYIATLLLSLVVIYGDASGCGYEYKLQPAGASDNCSLEEYTQDLELRCQVSGLTDTFTILWHYSIFPPIAQSTEYDGSLTVDIVTTDTNFVRIKEQRLPPAGVPTSIISLLTITVSDQGNTDYYHNMIDGYYWCSVNSTTYDTPNPSQVVNISTDCFFASDQRTKCNLPISLHETPSQSRCADFQTASIDIVNMCPSQDTQIVQPPTPSVDHEYFTTKNSILTETTKNGKTTTTADGQEMSNSDPQEESTSSTTTGTSTHIVWISVGVGFAVLIAIIAIMLIAIVCLTHKKNRLKVSSPHMNARNPYIEYGNSADSLKRDTLVGSQTGHDGSKSTANEAEVQYATLTNVIHSSQNTTFGGGQSPDSSTSLRIASNSVRIQSSLPGEYEDVSNLMAARGHRNQYETVENEGPPEYSHLQHAHGGSQRRKFGTKSPGALTLPPPVPASNNRGRITATLSWSGHKTEPVFDSPTCTAVGVGDSKSSNNQVETTLARETTGYSHINHEALKSTESVEPPVGPDSEGYHQLPSVFIEEAKKLNQPQLISSDDRQNIHTTTAAQHSVHRHNSATANDATSDAYTLIDPSKVKQRNSYSVSIVSTDDRYVSEQGHVYQVLERSDEHQQKRSSTSGSNVSNPKFIIQEEGGTKDGHTSGTIPPYGQVTKSPKQAQRKLKDTEQDDQSASCSFSQESSEGNSDDSGRKIPPYSQVDKSKKKKNRQAQAEVEQDSFSDDTHHYHVLEQSDEHESQNTNHYHVLEQVEDQDTNDTHHYHVLEQQGTNGMIEEPCSVEGGPIYHIIDHKP